MLSTEIDLLLLQGPERGRPFPPPLLLPLPPHLLLPPGEVRAALPADPASLRRRRLPHPLPLPGPALLDGRPVLQEEAGDAGDAAAHHEEAAQVRDDDELEK